MTQMELPKYTICKNLQTGKFEINKRRKVISSHDTKEIAESECQRLVENDNWNASNR